MAPAGLGGVEGSPDRGFSEAAGSLLKNKVREPYGEEGVGLWGCEIQDDD